MVVDDLEFSDVAMGLHESQKLDDKLGDRPDENLFLALPLGVDHGFEAVSQDVHFDHWWLRLYQYLSKYQYFSFKQAMLTSPHDGTFTPQTTHAKRLLSLIFLLLCVQAQDLIESIDPMQDYSEHPQPDLVQQITLGSDIQIFDIEEDLKNKEREWEIQQQRTIEQSSFTQKKLTFGQQNKSDFAINRSLEVLSGEQDEHADEGKSIWVQALIKYEQLNKLKSDRIEALREEQRKVEQRNNHYEIELFEFYLIIFIFFLPFVLSLVLYQKRSKDRKEVMFQTNKEALGFRFLEQIQFMEIQKVAKPQNILTFTPSVPKYCINKGRSNGLCSFCIKIEQSKNCDIQIGIAKAHSSTKAIFINHYCLYLDGSDGKVKSTFKEQIGLKDQTNHCLQSEVISWDEGIAEGTIHYHKNFRKFQEKDIIVMKISLQLGIIVWLINGKAQAKVFMSAISQYEMFLFLKINSTHDKVIAIKQ